MDLEFDPRRALVRHGRPPFLWVWPTADSSRVSG
jgi:hypothetical protein